MKVLVIGGGMAGLTYAIMSARQGNSVCIVEGNARLGRKIAMSGNGKCNIGNKNITADCYNDNQVVRHVIGKVSIDDYLRFLTSVGIYTYSDECGRLYPVTDSASSVVDCLRFEAARFGVKTVQESKAHCIKKVESGYCVTADKEYFADKVVVACGSRSQADETNLDKLVGEKYLTRRVPSLVPVRVSDMDGVLNGVRNRAVVTLRQDGKIVCSKSGEVQFKDYGLSGVCIFELSAIIARNQVKGETHSYKFTVDLLPDIQENKLVRLTNDNITLGRDPLVGLVKNRVADYVRKQIDTNEKDYAAKVAHLVKNVPFTFEKLLDYSMSQVTSGGVDVKFVSLPSLQLPNGVVVLGEALDVDGTCGGYNLYFAAASALSLFM